MSKLYTSTAIQELADRYLEAGGAVYELEEGTLGWGLTVMVGEGLKTAVVQEVPLDAWSSAHKLRMYNQTPKKYADAIDNI